MPCSADLQFQFFTPTVTAMQYDVSFGRLDSPPRSTKPGSRFRLAVLGDFSGRANAGLLETGADLARRKPVAVDVDNLDDVLARMKLALSLDLGDGNTVPVPVASMDDFHPEQLVENVELFETLLQLRRNLSSKAGFAAAAKEVLSWSGEVALPRARRAARGTHVATDLRLSDFARLSGRVVPKAPGTEVDDLVRRLVGPYVLPSRDPRQPELLAQVDQALSIAMRQVLHHPDFQTAEATWRGVEMLVRRIETGARMQIVLYDVSAEELAADLAATDALQDTGLYGLMVEQPAMDADQGPLSAVIGLYGFELSPPHADLLGRIAQVAQAAGAPFLTGIDPDALQTRFEDQHVLNRQAWPSLWSLPEAAYLGLLTPRFLMRMPYGKTSDPIDPFAFEEFTREAGLSGMLWGHPAVIAGLVLAQAWGKAGARMQAAGGTVGDMPYYVYKAPDGESVALPCTERLYSERQAAQVRGYHVMPLVTLRGRPEVRLPGFAAVTGAGLAGFWAPSAATAGAPPAPEPAVAEPEPETEHDVAEPAVSAPDADDLDALLADLGGPATAAEAAEPSAEEPEAAAPEADDLDALLASLSAPAEPVAEGDTEDDLDALLASL